MGHIAMWKIKFLRAELGSGEWPTVETDYGNSVYG